MKYTIGNYTIKELLSMGKGVCSRLCKINSSAISFFLHCFSISTELSIPVISHPIFWNLLELSPVPIPKSRILIFSFIKWLSALKNKSDPFRPFLKRNCRNQMQILLLVLDFYPALSFPCCYNLRELYSLQVRKNK